MSPLIRTLTLVLLLLPVVFFATALVCAAPLAIPGALVAALYAWAWLRMRPTRFVVSADAVEVAWPLRRRRIPRAEITAVRRLDAAEVKQEIGFAMRVGVGGLWGGFGWLWSSQRGVIQMYVSRTDGFVWIETRDRPWLLTPAEPDRFVRALSPSQ